MIRTSLAVLALVLAGSRVAADSPPADKHIGKKIEATKVESLTGKSVGLADLRGKSATVVVFVATECPVSNSYIAPLGEMAKQYAEKGVAVAVVCPTDESAEAIAKWAKSY